MSGTGSRLNLEPLNPFFFKIFQKHLSPGFSTVIFLVNSAFMKDYVEVCEARKDYAPHTGWKIGTGTSL